MEDLFLKKIKDRLDGYEEPLPQDGWQKLLEATSAADAARTAADTKGTAGTATHHEHRFMSVPLRIWQTGIAAAIIATAGIGTFLYVNDGAGGVVQTEAVQQGLAQAQAMETEANVTAMTSATNGTTGEGQATQTIQATPQTAPASAPANEAAAKEESATPRDAQPAAVTTSQTKPVVAMAQQEEAVRPADIADIASDDTQDDNQTRRTVTARRANAPVGLASLNAPSLATTRAVIQETDNHAAAAEKNGVQRRIDEVVRQIMAEDDGTIAVDMTTAYDTDKAWKAAGLAQVISELPPAHTDVARYTAQFRELAAMLAAAQDADGLWHGTTSANDVEGSALVCYAIAWGMNQGILERSPYHQTVMKAWNAIGGTPDSDSNASEACRMAGQEVGKL